MPEKWDTPSLCAGALLQWNGATRAKQGWKVTPSAAGIEAWLGKTGISGNWVTGYVVIDMHRRPEGLEAKSLQDAINTVETRGEELAAATQGAELKEKEPCTRA